MCGIVGYVGPREAAAVLVDCLSRLEYRGYDSAGLAVLNGRGVETRKLAGRIEGLRALVTREPVHGRCGIGHTRWATHGAPTERNAHPHSDCTGGIALVHNGIIENADLDRKSTRLNSSHVKISYAVFCLKKKKKYTTKLPRNRCLDASVTNAHWI